ncbi:MAG: hypothetical protein ACQ9MH_14435 [Nitrospinales bacterium]
MFYPVRILNQNLRLKKTISSEELSNIHWKKFHITGIKPGNDHSGYKFQSKERKTLIDKFAGPERKNKNQKKMH